MTPTNRNLASKILFTIAVVLAVAWLFSVTLGTLNLGAAVLLFIALGLLVM